MARSNLTPLFPPGEPDHPRQCDNCHGWLKRYNWECELIPEDKAVVWYTYCGKCGSMNTDG